MNIVNVSTAEQHIWKNSFRKFFHKYKHGLLQLYFLIYFPWFHWLEKTVTSHFHTIHMEIDDMIPFIEYFIVPYFLWFAYVAVAIMFFFFTNKEDYYKLCAFLFIGMTISLIICTIWPNGTLFIQNRYAYQSVSKHPCVQFHRRQYCGLAQ